MPISYSLYTIAFCFWCIYLFDAIKHKRRYYKSALRCLQGEHDLHQKIKAYNAKTELVKYVYLFCMNLVEWIGVIFGLVAYLIPIIQEYVNIASTNQVYRGILWGHNLPDINNVSLMLNSILIGCLCMYLAARQAQKSWVKANRIPIIICIFLLCSTAIQIMVSISYIRIIGLWFDQVLVSIALMFAFKQYRKLKMVINWTIIDLQVMQRKKLLTEQIRMKRVFTITFCFIWIGALTILASDYIRAISRTIQVISREYDASVFYLSLCENSTYSHPDIGKGITILTGIDVLLGTIGCLIIFIPYTGYGLITMFVIQWRLCRGMTGYRTHFKNPLYAPLI
ncbi:hypothetical protein LOD99_8358 [Oopsacas minuta]|uniref:Uncharacterized protein n=1 Tax=Oopsacas minuta TaxID=111878 RepID=A0AAV7JGB0_9METZ|nr:hypothetical protein LOD99_8358 [Oopsacas minuta]